MLLHRHPRQTLYGIITHVCTSNIHYICTSDTKPLEHRQISCLIDQAEKIRSLINFVTLLHETLHILRLFVRTSELLVDVILMNYRDVLMGFVSASFSMIHETIAWLLL